MLMLRKYRFVIGGAALMLAGIGIGVGLALSTGGSQSHALAQITGPNYGFWVTTTSEADDASRQVSAHAGSQVVIPTNVPASIRLGSVYQLALPAGSISGPTLVLGYFDANWTGSPLRAAANGQEWRVIINETSHEAIPQATATALQLRVGGFSAYEIATTGAPSYLVVGKGRTFNVQVNAKSGPSQQEMLPMLQSLATAAS